MTPGTPNHEPEGPRLRSWLLGALIAALILFAVFFTWYQNTSNLNENPQQSPVSNTNSQ